ncbi:MAG TPA: hypothetical protein VG269_11790 [Tepidisphaeraceae bacterium]|nr:hypothetical protein [Tepidisphaeraceae bacterium]
MRESVLLLSTRTQQTWLVATDLRLFCLLDDQGTRASGRVIQWSEPKEHVGPVSADARLKSQLGLLSMPPHEQWYYSRRLHPSTDELEQRVTEMLQGPDRPPMSSTSPKSPKSPKAPKRPKGTKSAKKKTSKKK